MDPEGLGLVWWTSALKPGSDYMVFPIFFITTSDQVFTVTWILAMSWQRDVWPRSISIRRFSQSSMTSADEGQQKYSGQSMSRISQCPIVLWPVAAHITLLKVICAAPGHNKTVSKSGWTHAVWLQHYLAGFGLDSDVTLWNFWMFIGFGVIKSLWPLRSLWVQVSKIWVRMGSGF